MKHITVLGAGPAGLGAAWKLAQRGFAVTLVERGDRVGGNSGSFDFAGLQVDYGSHRLHPSCSPEILTDIRSMLGGDLLDRPRHGRIHLRGRWLHFPLKPVDAALHAPPAFLAGALRDALISRKATGGESETFASVLQRGLGPTICRDFYFPYALKIWGLEPEQLDPEQARRRVSAGSVAKLAGKFLRRGKGSGKGRFFYPRQGFGQISEGYREAALRAGAELRLRTSVTAVEPGRVTLTGPRGEETIETACVLSTIPVTMLARMIRPEAPASVGQAAASLQYRSMILIYLALDREQFTEFDAHYFPASEIAITRLSEPKNYGLSKLPGRTVLCAELPCSKQDRVWNSGDSVLADLVVRALREAGLPDPGPILEVASRRLPEAYPIYTLGYKPAFETIDHWLDSVEGVVSLGRQGLFAHDNTHHTLAMAYAAVECLSESAEFDRNRWSAARREFESFVVED